MLYLKTFESFKEFPHRFQSKDYTCGPTAMKIVLDFIKYPDVSVDYLEKISGTDNVIGCTDVSMSQMLNHLGIKYERIVDQTQDKSFDDLDEHLKEGKVILRTLTKGIKHWIVVYAKVGGFYKCSDPWLGLITYDKLQIDSIWQPRNYDAFLVQTSNERPKIEKIEKKDIPIVLEISKDIFRPIIGDVDWMEDYLLNDPDNCADWNESVKLTLNGQIIGCYLLAPRNLKEEYLKECPEFVGKKGLEGVCLGIDPMYKSLGYGKMLIAYTENLHYDYIWGEHLKDLDNIDHWKKRREKIIDAGNVWVSIKTL